MVCDLVNQWFPKFLVMLPFFSIYKILFYLHTDEYARMLADIVVDILAGHMTPPYCPILKFLNTPYTAVYRPHPVFPFLLFVMSAMH